MRKFNKAALDIWESQYLCGTAMKKNGKRSHKRAQRRLDKGIIQEQLS